MGSVTRNITHSTQVEEELRASQRQLARSRTATASGGRTGADRHAYVTRRSRRRSLVAVGHRKSFAPAGQAGSSGRAEGHRARGEVDQRCWSTAGPSPRSAGTTRRGLRPGITCAISASPAAIERSGGGISREADRRPCRSARSRLRHQVRTRPRSRYSRVFGRGAGECPASTARCRQGGRPGAGGRRAACWKIARRRAARAARRKDLKPAEISWPARHSGAA